MALSGRLEDMNLLEILQIVAFSKKTGSLDVSSPLASGALLFREGRILCAVSTSTAPALSSLAAAPLDASRLGLLHAQVRAALRELVGLRNGSFEFKVGSLPIEWSGLDISSFLITKGVAPQEVMLELAKELDESRRHSSRLLAGEAAPEALAPPEPTGAGDHPHQTATILLVDDEPFVLEALRAALDAEGFDVVASTSPKDALRRLDELFDRGGAFVLVTDLAMPSADGESFGSGLEVVEGVRRVEPDAPVLLMAETLSSDSRARARELGVRRVAFKPALTKLDPEEYASDLRAFAEVVKKEVGSLVAASREPAHRLERAQVLNHDVMFEFLKTMTAELARPDAGIARMILRVAAKYVDRGALFLVRGARATGLAGIRAGCPTHRVVPEVEKLAFELQQVEPLAEVVYSRKTVWVPYDTHPLPEELDCGKAPEGVLLPLLHSHEVIAILLCDNPDSGAPIPRITGLELFLTQAGMAMENATLHRRLQSRTGSFSIEDQGPLTQELSRIARGDP